MKNITVFLDRGSDLFQSESIVAKHLPKAIKPESTSALKYIAEHCNTPVVMFSANPSLLKFEAGALDRIEAALNEDAIIAYGDYTDVLEDGTLSAHPLIDYTGGAVSDSFEFGKAMFTTLSAVREYVAQAPKSYSFAGVYAFRLWASRKGKIARLAGNLYSAVREDNRKSGQKQFDYLNPQFQRRQKEMEAAFTEYLKTIGAFISPKQIKPVDFSKDGKFDFEASVVIPVRNRARTVADAVKSALSQKANFKFNVIVVDNHSTDGTTDILKQLASEHKNLVHLIPERTDLGIGGCWQLAADSEKCGRFAVQLDSDDIYSDENTLAKIVSRFHRTHAAMVIGSYRLVDFNLHTLPPGVIDHKEWTSANGRNNALRINGLGAPRAFYTPMLREIRFPNTSYGEDYALGLAFSREHYLSRIYDVLYLCRRWEDNSDASLSQEKTNKNNAYKNSLREAEIVARQKLNSKK